MGMYERIVSNVEIRVSPFSVRGPEIARYNVTAVAKRRDKSSWLNIITLMPAARTPREHALTFCTRYY